MNRVWRGPSVTAFLGELADRLHPTGRELVEPLFISNRYTEESKGGEFLTQMKQDRTNFFGPTPVIRSRALSYVRPSEASSVFIC
jgi:hypothetical protein